MDTKQRGRKPSVINFPDGNFTTKQLATVNHVSMVTAQKRINMSVTNKQIHIIGKDKNPGKGRKFTIYNRMGQ